MGLWAQLILSVPRALFDWATLETCKGSYPCPPLCSQARLPSGDHARSCTVPELVPTYAGDVAVGRYWAAKGGGLLV